MNECIQHGSWNANTCGPDCAEMTRQWAEGETSGRMSAGLSVGDRVRATKCSDPMYAEHTNVTGVVERLMGTTIAFRAEAPLTGYLMFAKVKDVEAAG